VRKLSKNNRNILLLVSCRVNSLAKTSAYQLQRTDVRVNTICPGLIETGMTGDTFEYARQRGTAAKLGQLNPLARFGVSEGTSGVHHIQIISK
jgi:NAD(P)-dependent dehydrogenase (short-subunit alcohol dehydrogenase family)